jgi:hypothetical protein
MKKTLALILLASACVRTSAQSAMNAGQEVLEARKQMSAAAAKGDKVAWGKFLADDLTWVDRAGRLRDKVTVLEEVWLGPPAADQRPASDTEARSYDNAAVLIAIAHNNDGSDTRFVQVWAKKGNQWQLLAHQGVGVGDPITKIGPQTGFGTEQRADQSTRIHGSVEVTTQRIFQMSFADGTKGPDLWQTIASVKEGGRWRRAATVTTPVAGTVRRSAKP